MTTTPPRPLHRRDCLLKLGMAPLESDDAAVRALAIRRLWRKLDNIEERDRLARA